MAVRTVRVPRGHRLVTASLIGVLGVGVYRTIADFTTGLDEPYWASSESVKEIEQVSTLDGIVQQEASSIAFAYWESHQAFFCGGPERIELDGDWWKTCFRVGYAGDRDGGCLRIHERSGAITSTFARPYRDLDHLRAHLVAYAW